MVALLVCRTCPRYDADASGGFARRLLAAIANLPGAAVVPIRGVACLGGCPDDGVVALAGHGKARVRFTRLSEADADAVVRAAEAHGDCPTGTPGDWEVPAELIGRLGSVTPTRVGLG